MWKKYFLLIEVITFAVLGWSASVEEGITNDPGIPNDASIPNDISYPSYPFVRIGDGYYYIERNRRENWYKAYEECREIGAELVSFETVKEWDDIVRYLTDRNDRRPYWTSGNDLAREGVHNWFTNAQPISINKWARYQPNNYKDNEHCVHFKFFDHRAIKYELNDNPCFTRDTYYICEAPRPASFVILKNNWF